MFFTKVSTSGIGGTFLCINANLQIGLWADGGMYGYIERYIDDSAVDSLYMEWVHLFLSEDLYLGTLWTAR